ncbi:MAG TPA: polysaccharide biosynthesis/export family protein [Caulobacteraceae bacterium]|jgi:polysaccharide export outer membrane protein
MSAAPRACALSALLLLGACLPVEPFTPRPRATAEFPNIAYADWTEFEPEYRLAPGDEFDLVVPSAPELNRTLKVGFDGRVMLPLDVKVMAADRAPEELEGEIAAAYAPHLVRPDVEVVVKQAQPMKIFVGGEVGDPGMYDMAGDIDTLQAVIQAGGFAPGARRAEVVVIRRGPDGRAMMRTVNLLRATTDASRADAVPLRRFDVVYVPRSTIAEVGLFVKQAFDAVPFASGFSYVLADRLVNDEE